MAKLVAALVFLLCLIESQAGSAQALNSPPDLSAIPAEERGLIEYACLRKKIDGPAAYDACLRDQMARLGSSPGHPDLSGVAEKERSLMEFACARKKLYGPVTYYACLRDQMARLRSSPRRPDLSGLPENERDRIEHACSTKQLYGPGTYYACLQAQLASPRQPGHAAPRPVSPSQEPPPTTPKSQASPESHASSEPQASSESEVYQAQNYLMLLGYDAGAVDGRIGPRTRRAIEAFQRDRGLKSDGKVSRALLTALQAAIGDRLRRRKAPQPGAAAPGIAASPRINWPAWRPVTSEQAAAIPQSHMNPAEVYEAVKDNVWVIVAGTGGTSIKTSSSISQGSAIAISPQDLVTNCHVVEGRPLIAIVQGKTIREAHLKSADPASDRCILTVDEPTLSWVQGVRPYSDLKIGERVYTVGAPRGLERTLGEGIISGLRPSKKARYVQTSAPVSPGSSGGGLFDSAGNLIGVTTFLVKEAQALNFAIAAEDYWR